MSDKRRRQDDDTTRGGAAASTSTSFWMTGTAASASTRSTPTPSAPITTTTTAPPPGAPGIAAKAAGFPHPLPGHPAARRMHHTDTDMSFAALGTKIFAFTNHRSGGTLVYDADTAVLSAAAAAPSQMARVGSRGFSLAAGDALYSLTYRHCDRQHPHSFHALSRAPTAAADDDDARPPWQHPTEGWAWKAPPPPPPFSSWVHSHALHPDGRTIFVTSSDENCRMGTCSFDAAAMDSGWRSHGNWVLPFHGEGHYDGELGAWVGLHRGYVCCCQPVSPGFVSTAPCFYVDCKVIKERMFSKKHMRVSLTSMGEGKFCLVECVAAEKKEKRRRRPIYGARDGCVIHLTVFGLEYDHRGELQVKDDRSTQSFLVSRHRPHFAPQAFWM